MALPMGMIMATKIDVAPEVIRKSVFN